MIIRMVRNAAYEWNRECLRKISQMGEIEYKRSSYDRNRNISDKVAAEFLAKVFHPRIRSKSHFVHCRESPAKASILLVLSVLNVG